MTQYGGVVGSGSWVPDKESMPVGVAMGSRLGSNVLCLSFHGSHRVK